MEITPLQLLLQEKVVPLAEICQAVGRSRWTVWRWQVGQQYPSPAEAAQLIELFGDERLDFNGCYQASIDAGEGEG